MTIKQRILAGFGSVMIFVIIMGGWSAVVMHSIQDGIERYGLAADRADDGREVEGLVTRIKVPVNQWLRSTNKTFVGLADIQIAELSKLLTRLDAEIRDPNRRTLVANLLRARDAYIEHWTGMQSRTAEIIEAYAADDTLTSDINQTLTTGLRDDVVADAAARDGLVRAAIAFARADAQFLRFRASEDPMGNQAAMDQRIQDFGTSASGVMTLGCHDA